MEHNGDAAPKRYIFVLASVRTEIWGCVARSADNAIPATGSDVITR